MSAKRALFSAFWQGALGIILCFVDFEEFMHGNATLPNIAIGIVAAIFLVFAVKALVAALFPNAISINNHGIVWNGYMYTWADIFHYESYQLHDGGMKTQYLRVIRIYLEEEDHHIEGQAGLLTRLWRLFRRKHRRTFDVSHFDASNEDILEAMHYHYFATKG